MNFKTAELLKERLNYSKSLAYVTTSNIVNSKWCPWELGYFDGFKNKCFILPVLDKKEDLFKGQEFLDLYPYIEYEDGEFWIKYPRDSMSPQKLKDWLN